ncbi:MAG: single-stranded-DNA-specific exonuclease RecJ [Cytophagales bacterium]|nr:MAG: single-stranded-DNA-specific exonuclease RecJ [Cytophagales bacterium]
MNIKLKPIPNQQKAEELSKLLNINILLSNLLIQREIDNFENAKSFFRPNLNEIHNPFLMKNMDKAVEKIIKAIENKEKILIYGDYDVDGTTAVALVFDFLGKYHTHIDYYVPDRYTEGYGISTLSIDFAKENNFSLVIALDCGIKSNEKINYANTLGIDFIICDHHEPGEEIPKALAVLDAKQNDCNYPYKELSGCGVGFKLMQAYCIKKNIELDKLFPYLDLLCVSIGADIVPIDGENRIFCYHGLKIINENPRFGIKSLIGISGFKKQFKISDVVFKLAPRINAAGRIHHAKAAINLLISNTEEEAEKWATKLNDSNIYRKELDKIITEEAIEMIENQVDFLSLKSTVLFKNDWNKGVIGIVASRCIEKYYKPTIILTESNGIAAGSARSVHGFDLYNAISNCSDYLAQFGGHTHAAGMTLKIENIENFRKAFEKQVSKTIKEDSLTPQMLVDMEVPLSFVSLKTEKIISQMQPFGPKNMTPVFITKGLIDGGNSRVVGEIHLKLDLHCPTSNIKIAGIAFQKGNLINQIQQKHPFTICYTLEENIFNNIKTVQAQVKEIIFE